VAKRALMAIVEVVNFLWRIMKSVNLSWNAVTTDTTGGPLGGLITYNVYSRPQGGTYGTPLNVSTNSASITMAVAGPHQALVTAVGPDGSESAHSNEVSFMSVPQTPAAPTGLVVVP